MRSGNSALVDRRFALLSALLAFALVLLMMTLASMGSNAAPASNKTAVRSGSVVLGADGSNSSCVGECSGGPGGDSNGGTGGTSFGGSSLPGSSGQAGIPGEQGLSGTPGIPGTSGTPGSSGETNQSSFSDSADSTNAVGAPEGQAASPDQFVPVNPESTQLPPPLPEPTCSAGDLLGLGSLLAPLADLLKLLNLC